MCDASFVSSDDELPLPPATERQVRRKSLHCLNGDYKNAVCCRFYFRYQLLKDLHLPQNGFPADVMNYSYFPTWNSVLKQNLKPFLKNISAVTFPLFEYCNFHVNANLKAFMSVSSYAMLTVEDEMWLVRKQITVKYCQHSKTFCICIWRNAT